MALSLQKIKFQTNIPVEAALKFAEGKLCDSQFGDPQYMFTTTDDRVFFVAEKVAQRIHGLHLKPEEPFEIIKAEKDYGNNRKGIEWQVNRVGFVPGEQPDGTFAVSVAPVTSPSSSARVQCSPRKYLDEAAPEIRPAALEQSILGEIGGVPVRGYIDLVDVDGASST
jgi:hypothetical protein